MFDEIIALDNGSDMLRGGFVGNDLPKCVIQNEIAK